MMQTAEYPINHNGFTLVEVMVALVIFSISMLGLAGLQISALRDNQIANQHTIATQLASDMAERIRANPAGADNGSYSTVTIQPGSAPDCYGASCGYADIAQMDAYEWFAALQNALPSGTGEVVSNSGGFTITVKWDQDRTGTSGTGCNDLKCLTFTMQP